MCYVLFELSYFSAVQTQKHIILDVIKYYIPLLCLGI